MVRLIISNDNPRNFVNLKQLIDDNAVLFEKKPCYIFHRGINVEELSFGDFKEYVDCMGTAFHSIGLKGATVGIIGETTPEWIAIYMSAVVSGGVALPLDSELAPNEIVNFINRAGAECVFHSKSARDIFTVHADSMPNVKFFVEIPSEDFVRIKTLVPGGYMPSSRFISFETFMAYGKSMILRGESSYELYEQDMKKMSALLFTSGTTGTAKGVMLSQQNIVTVVRAVGKVLDVNTTDVAMSVLPIHHSYEMCCGILCSMYFGMTQCINDKRKNVVKNLKLFKPTIVPLVPLYVSAFCKKIWDTAAKRGQTEKLKTIIMASNLLRRVKIDARGILFRSVREAFGGRLNKIICGGAAMNPVLIKTFDALGIQLSQGYGITECAPLVAVVPFKSILDKPTSCGRVIPGVTVTIDKQDESDEAGEIIVKGDNVMLGYYNDPEQTAQVLQADGSLRTGDYGYVDEDGFIYITGRKKNVIIAGNGKNVFPEEIENYLEDISLIEECVVVGKPDENDPDAVIITAIIFPNAETAAAAMLNNDDEITAALKKEIAKINDKLPGFKHVKGIVIRNEPFNKTSSRKIKRFEINQ